MPTPTKSSSGSGSGGRSSESGGRSETESSASVGSSRNSSSDNDQSESDSATEGGSSSFGTEGGDTATNKSGPSSASTSATSRRGGIGRAGRTDSSMSSSSSDDSGSDGGVGKKSKSLKSRMKSLFKKEPDEKQQLPRDLGDLNDRVDQKLLTEVQEYDAAPSEAASYGKIAFWDERFASDTEVVEWYHPWSNLASTLTPYMDEEDEVLVCGCGNSEMSVDMYDDGFMNVTNADASRVVIHQMSQTYSAYNMQWRAIDLTRADFPDEKFDVALDKACLDSLMCHRGESRILSYLQQMDRILQPEGAYICISFAPPEQRLELLEYWDLDSPDKCLAWDVHVDAIAKPEIKQTRRSRKDEAEVYYIYVCIKDPQKTTQKRIAKERAQREQEKKLNNMLGFRGRGRGRRGRTARR